MAVRFSIAHRKLVELLKKRREDLGLTFRALEARMPEAHPIEFSMLAKIEGLKLGIAYDQLRALCYALEWPIDELTKNVEDDIRKTAEFMIPKTRKKPKKR